MKNTFTEEMLKYEYKVCRSLNKMATKFGVSHTTIVRHMKKYNITYEKHPTTYTCNENIFQHDNEISFYLAGFIAADGNLRQQKYSKVLKITLSSNDRKHLEKIKIAFNSTHPIRTYEVKASPLVHTKDTYSSDEFTITSSKIFDDLRRFNIIPNKTQKYELPHWLAIHPLKNHFIRGYIDGDGTISSSISKKCKQQQITMSIVGNYDTLLVINNIFMRECSVRGSKINHKPKTKHTYRVRYAGNLQLQRIGKFLYDGATLFLDRKYQKIIQLL